MERAIAIIIALTTIVSVNAQETKEYITVYRDRDIYLAGEDMHLYININDSEGQKLDLSKVVYVELSDERHLVAQQMFDVEKGESNGVVTLPSSLHSGNYQLTAYTRFMRNYGEKSFYKQLVGVVNLTSLSHFDKIGFEKADTSFYEMPKAILTKKTEYRSGDKIEIIMPDEAEFTCKTLSIQRLDITTEQDFEATEQDFSGRSDVTFLPEYEGHIVNATSKDSTVTCSRMALIGQAPQLYDGIKVDNTTFCYLTRNMKGRLPMFIMGNSYDGIETYSMGIETPYCRVKTGKLPPLNIKYDRAALQERCEAVQIANALRKEPELDSALHQLAFMSFEPDKFYDLNEYAKFPSVREILIEFVKGVHRQKVEGRNQLFLFNKTTGRQTEWPALVLLDGVPVMDIDKILNYDARRLRYVQIYNGSFTFGATMCQGVISFISHRGKLTDYQLDTEAKLFSYQFPLENIIPEPTMQWTIKPDKQTTLECPDKKGIYRIIMQGVGPDGKGKRIVSEFEVK